MEFYLSMTTHFDDLLYRVATMCLDRYWWFTDQQENS